MNIEEKIIQSIVDKLATHSKAQRYLV